MRILSGSLIIVLSTIATSCAKHKNDCSLIPAKVIRYDCDMVIFQLLTNKNIGDTSWTDVQTGDSYNNVVSYYNTCQIASLTNGRFDTLYVKVEKTNEYLFANGCVQCLQASPHPPQTKVIFTDVQAQPCGMNE